VVRRCHFNLQDNAMTNVRSATDRVSQWGLFELTLDGPSSGNPFKAVELSATFSQGGRSVEVSGFYDGEGTYRVRFMPDTMGAWIYRTKSNTEGLDGATGTFEVGAAKAGDHGPVRVADTFHFAHADGTGFKPIGTTSYAWNHQGEAMERETLATLKASPFNKIRMCVFPKHYRYNENEPEFYPYPVTKTGTSNWAVGGFAAPITWEFDFERFEPAFFRHLEQRIADLQKIGVEADLIVFHPYDRWGFSKMSADQDDAYLRYLVARLAAFPNVWWSLANEYDLMPSKTLEDWDRFIRIIAENDPYGHLRSNHNCFAFYDHTHPLITHCSVQRPDTSQIAQWREQYGKPVIDDECCYEGNIAEAWGNISGREMVHRFWDGSVNGGYVTHGETYRHAGDVIWWAKGGKLEGESIARLHFLKKILDRVSSKGLEPIRDTGPFTVMLAGGKDKASLQTLMAKRTDKEFVRAHFAGAHDPHKTYLTYFGVSQPGEIEIAVPVDETYDAHLIDTWEMTETPLKKVKRGDLLNIPAKPYQALLLTRAN
jgi:hypothetical protein